VSAIRLPGFGRRRAQFQDPAGMSKQKKLDVVLIGELFIDEILSGFQALPKLYWALFWWVMDHLGHTISTKSQNLHKVRHCCSDNYRDDPQSFFKFVRTINLKTFPSLQQ